MTHVRLRGARYLVPAVLLIRVTGACARSVQVPPRCPPPPSPPPVERVPLVAEPATLRGHLRSLPDGQPVAQAEVALEGTDRRVTTDGAGAFRFDTLAAGRYGLRVRRIGFQGRRVDSLDVDAERGVRVAVPLERAVLDGCPGFLVFYERVPWWQVWRW